MADMQIDDADVQTTSGDIAIDEAVIGSSRFHSVSGDIDMDGIQGELALKTVSGDIEVRQSGGEAVTAESISGEIEVHVDRSSLRVSTFSGDVEVEADEVNYLEASSKSGDVTCHLKDHDITAVLSTKSGALKSDANLNEYRQSHHEWTVGNGTGHVVLSSKSGDVSLD